MRRFVSLNSVRVRLALALVAVLLAAGSAGHALPPPPPEIRFATPVLYPVPGPADLTVADFDGDGKQDVAARAPGNVALFWGLGDGGLSDPTLLPVGSSAETNWGQVAGADLDGDRKLDLLVVVGADNRLVVLPGLGHRQFGPAYSVGLGTLPNGLALADFNEDGRPDLVVTNHRSTKFSLLLNGSDGRLAVAEEYPVPDYSARVAAADFDADGHVDAAVSNYVQGNVRVFWGNGEGQLTAGPTLTVGAYPAQIVAADFNGDLRPDLATANTFGSSVSLLLSHGARGFTERRYSTPIYPHIMAAADFDGSGTVDLAVPHNGTSYFSTMDNAGGELLAPFTYETGGEDVRTLAVGDLNQDGKPDVITGNSSSSNLSVFLNESPGYPPIGKLRAPALLRFGTVRVGASRQKELLLRNRSRRYLSVDVAAPAAPFSLVGGPQHVVLEPNASARIQVTFQPTTSGLASGALILTSSDPSRRNSRVRLLGLAR